MRDGSESGAGASEENFSRIHHEGANEENFSRVHHEGAVTGEGRGPSAVRGASPGHELPDIAGVDGSVHCTAPEEGRKGGIITEACAVVQRRSRLAPPLRGGASPVPCVPVPCPVPALYGLDVCGLAAGLAHSAVWTTSGAGAVPLVPSAPPPLLEVKHRYA